MDEKTHIHTLKEKVKDFCDARDWDQFHNAKDLAIGITTESCELLEQFRFKSNDEIEKLFSQPETRNHICEEISDILHTVLRFAQKFNIDLSNELDKKMKKNEMKYPAKR